MHFRHRENVVQVIRTTYDSESKKARSEILGRLVKANPEISDKLRETCTPSEIGEIEQWIEEFYGTEALRNELAARTLAEQIERAGSWLAANASEDKAKRLAAEVQFAYSRLRNEMKKLGLVD